MNPDTIGTAPKAREYHVTSTDSKGESVAIITGIDARIEGGMLTIFDTKGIIAAFRDWTRFQRFD